MDYPQIQSDNQPQLTQSEQKHIAHLLKNSKAANTIKAYNSDWTLFTQFCMERNLIPLPAHVDTILLYLSHLSKIHAYSTIKRHLSSISKAHRTSNHANPTTAQNVVEIMQGIARTNGNKSTPKQAITLHILKRLIDSVDVSTLSGKRDKALILMAFATASRRSEVVLIDYTDVKFTDQGIDINIFEPKTNKHKVKSILGINGDYCPVEALREWLQASQIKYGAIFRGVNKANKIQERLSSHNVAKIVKKYAANIGLDTIDFAGHSLRSGFATSAAEEGYNTEAIMKQGGWATVTMASRYVQQGNRYKNNATGILSNLK